MEKGTKGNGKKANSTEKESKHCLMERSLMENGAKGDLKAWGCANILMVQSIQAIGSMVSPTEKELRFLLMAPNTQENGLMEKQTVKV